MFQQDNAPQGKLYPVGPHPVLFSASPDLCLFEHIRILLELQESQIIINSFTDGTPCHLATYLSARKS
ncbi:hypothetical protein NPIL_346401 [Nephila pilipes]|uniref:Uncharacterized protein n=1 Tax=Nephila pilipes TaxID=299642 RepID=A0A8X6MZA9_NEPPI|nr:hypothetical protein NPIL_346401 [Nephila pilipes]